jgi:hypothetical protein
MNDELKEKIACIICGGVDGCSENSNTELRWKDAYCIYYLKKSDQILNILADAGYGKMVEVYEGGMLCHAFQPIQKESH